MYDETFRIQGKPEEGSTAICEDRCLQKTWIQLSPLGHVGVGAVARACL